MHCIVLLVLGIASINAFSLNDTMAGPQQYYCGQAWDPLKELLANPGENMYRTFFSPAAFFFGYPYLWGCDPAELSLSTQSGVYFSLKFNYSTTPVVATQPWTTFKMMNGSREISFSGDRRTYTIHTQQESSSPGGQRVQSVKLRCDFRPTSATPDEVFAFTWNLTTGNLISVTHILPKDCHEPYPGTQDFLSWYYEGNSPLPYAFRRNGVDTTYNYTGFPFTWGVTQLKVVAKTLNKVTESTHTIQNWRSLPGAQPQSSWSKLVRTDVKEITIWTQLPVQNITTNEYFILYNYDISNRLREIWTSKDVVAPYQLPQTKLVFAMNYNGDPTGSLKSVTVTPHPDPVFDRPQPFYPFGDSTFMACGSAIKSCSWSTGPISVGATSRSIKVKNICRGTWAIENWNSVNVTVAWAFVNNTMATTSVVITPNGTAMVWNGKGKVLHVWFNNSLFFVQPPQTKGKKCLDLVPMGSGTYEVRNLIPYRINYNWITMGTQGRVGGEGFIEPLESAFFNTTTGGRDEVVTLYLERSQKEDRKRGRKPPAPTPAPTLALTT